MNFTRKLLYFISYMPHHSSISFSIHRKSYPLTLKNMSIHTTRTLMEKERKSRWYVMLHQHTTDLTLLLQWSPLSMCPCLVINSVHAYPIIFFAETRLPIVPMYTTARIHISRAGFRLARPHATCHMLENL